MPSSFGALESRGPPGPRPKGRGRPRVTRTATTAAAACAMAGKKTGAGARGWRRGPDRDRSGAQADAGREQKTRKCLARRAHGGGTSPAAGAEFTTGRGPRAPRQVRVAAMDVPRTGPTPRTRRRLEPQTPSGRSQETRSPPAPSGRPNPCAGGAPEARRRSARGPDGQLSSGVPRLAQGWASSDSAMRTNSSSGMFPENRVTRPPAR